MTLRSAIGNVPRGAAAISVGLGLTALLGWWLDQPTLRNGFGSGVAMNPVTAVAFVFAGASLWSLCAASPGPWLRRLGWAAAVGVLLIAALKLGELLFGWPFAVDQVVFPSRLALPGGGLPNRMAPNTAFAFLLLGGALLLVRGPNDFRRLLGLSLALLGGVGGTLTLIGYAYRRMTLTGLPGAIPMAVNTGLGFCALAIGITVAGARREEPRPGEDAGQAVRRRVNVALAVAVGILVLISGVSIWAGVRSREAALQRKESLVRHARLTSILELAQDAETSLRGYLLTGAPEFLEPLQSALASFPEQLRAADSLLRRETSQARRLTVLAPLVREEFAFLTNSIRGGDSGRRAEATPSAQSSRGKQIMDQIRQVIAAMTANEDELLARWDARRRTADGISLFTNLVAGLLAVFFLILAGRTLNADLLLRVRNALQMRKLHRELARQYEALQRLEKLRDSLVHMLVHDLRSPLSGISGYLELATDRVRELASPDLLADFEEIGRSVRMMTDMVSNVLDVSRFEEGAMPLNLVAVDLRTLAAEAIATLGRSGQATVHFAPPPEAVSAMADADAIRRVIANLVGNAVKFTPRDGVVVVEVGAGSSGPEVRVTDTGPGIPVEHHHRIFEKFGQVAGADGPRIPASGLGLTFCKLAVEAHGGRIGLRSEVGKGSIFWLSLAPPLTG